MNTLYQKLMNLINLEDSSFYMVERVGFDNKVYQIFSYRLASYTDFIQDGALECRGHMFRNGELVSLPFAKFLTYSKILWSWI